MRARLAFLLGLLLLGAGSKYDRLSAVEKDHFDMLRVWMNEDQQKAFLKLKTEEERNTYLQDKGFWDRWYKYDEAKRDKMLHGEVVVGWSYDMLLMAFGNPHERKRLAGRMATRSELYVYRFEVGKDGAVFVWEPKSKESYKAVAKYQLSITVDDEVVTQIARLDDWN